MSINKDILFLREALINFTFVFIPIIFKVFINFFQFSLHFEEYFFEVLFLSFK